VKERWTKWDSLCEGSAGPGPHRLRISPYDPEHRVWVVNETFNQIYVFSNDGRKLLKTLGEKNVPGHDGTHFAKPQDVAFLPDGRILVADGLDNHRVMILDRNANYISEFGSFGKGLASLTVCTLSQLTGRMIFARSVGWTHQRVQDDVRSSEGGVRRRICGLRSLDLIVNSDSLWLTDLSPLRFRSSISNPITSTPGSFKELPDGYLGEYTITVDSNGNLYGGDSQYGRAVHAEGGADPALLIGASGWPLTGDQTSFLDRAFDGFFEHAVGTSRGWRVEAADVRLSRRCAFIACVRSSRVVLLGRSSIVSSA
jgi:hypothetical protein